MLLTLLGRAARREGDNAAAEACYRQAIAWDPTDAAPHVELGELAIAARQFAEAAVSLRQALRLSPRDAQAASGLGAALRHLGRPEEAARWQRLADALARQAARREGPRPRSAL